MCNSFNCDDSGKMHLNASDVESIGNIFNCTHQQTGNLKRKQSKAQNTKWVERTKCTLKCSPRRRAKWPCSEVRKPKTLCGGLYSLVQHQAQSSWELQNNGAFWAAQPPRWVVGECQSNMDKLHWGTTQNPTAGVIFSFSVFLNTIYIYLLHW